MILYAKVINQETKACDVGIGTNESFYKASGMTQMDVEKCEWNGCWYVAGYVPAEPTPTKEKQIELLKQQLSAIDERSARSMRAILANTATDDDRAYLASLETQAASLRQQIRDLEDEIQ